MATYGSANVGFWLVNGYSLLGVVTEFSDTSEALTEDTTVLGSSWVGNSLTGNKRMEMTQTGFFDDTAGGLNDALVAANGVLQIGAFGWEGNTIGKQFAGFAGPLQAKYLRSVKSGELHKARAEYVGSGANETGRVLHALGAETAASGNTQTTPYDAGASSAAGASSYLEVTALTLGGFTSVTIKTRHSVDNITYADLATFANVTAAPNAQRVLVAGTVNRYLASSWLFNGAGSSESITYFVGVARS